MKLIIVLAIFSAAIGFGYLKFDELTRPLPLPELKLDKYWGPGDASKYKPDETIKPFKITTTKEEIADLRTQLNRTLKLTEPLEGIKFEYGFNSDALDQVVEYWRDNYLPRWKEREEYLNKFPQYTTEIHGLRIHYIHAKPDAEVYKNKIVLPLLILHGWPGSVREFYDFIPLLTENSETGKYAFEVVAPSLVGYGWSQGASKTGFNSAEMAIVMRNLMLRVGYEKFLIQGGDWGSIIGSYIATIFPNNVLGYHSNMCVMFTPLSIMKYIVASFYPEKVLPSRFFVEHHFPIKDKLELFIRESGYFHIQATKPDTIGTALLQNPVGLASYILEKFQAALGPGVNQKFNAMHMHYSMDAVIDNLMVYYLTNTATTAARLYAENMSKDFRALNLDRVQTPVPTACARFRWDLPSAFDWQLKDKYPNLIHNMYFQQGGHFAAMELPVMLYLDFVEFVAKANLTEFAISINKRK